jgi:outer membrane protein TolC
MKILFQIIFLFLLFSPYAQAQSSISSILSTIEKNNKTLQFNGKYWEAKKLEYQIGLTPSNPKINYDYLIGTPSNAGNQIEFSVNQTLDFPTTYVQKKQLSDEQIKQIEFQITAVRQEVLLKSKLICIELIYRNKLYQELNNRKLNTEKWLLAFEKSLEKGAGNIMDVNKAKLQLIEINAEFQENQSLINQLSQNLAELNGGIPIPFSEISYEPILFIPNFETLEKEIELFDPIRKLLEQEKIIGQKEINLTKLLSLPKLDAGYRYQTILGQQFNGLHLGLTVPLWENKNIVKSQQAQLLVNEAILQEHINEHYFDIKKKYEKLSNLKITLEKYQVLFNSSNNSTLLEKSLSLGQISTIEYFIEMSFYFEALKNYLITEMEYHKVVAELYKHQL